MNYQFNPLLESEGFLKLAPKRLRNALAKYLKKIRRGSKLDPVMATTTFSPIPGGVIIGNAYVDAVNPETRARAYRLFLDRPDKALVKGTIGIPKTVAKTAINIPGSTMRAIDDLGMGITKFGLKHGIDLPKAMSTIPLPM